MKEGKTLMKQLKKEYPSWKCKVALEKKKKNAKMEREKAFEEVQWMSMVDPSIPDTAAYHIIEDDWLKETTVWVLLWHLSSWVL